MRENTCPFLSFKQGYFWNSKIYGGARRDHGGAGRIRPILFKGDLIKSNYNDKMNI